MECREQALDAAVVAASPYAQQDFFGGSGSSP